MPDKFENATSFFRLGLPCTLIRMNPDKFLAEKGTFRIRSSEWKNLKTPASRFTVDGEHFENETFRNLDVTIILYDFSGSAKFSNFVRIQSCGQKTFYTFLTKTGEKRSVFKFIQMSVAENILCGVFKFIRHCVDGA